MFAELAEFAKKVPMRQLKIKKTTKSENCETVRL